MVIKSRGKQLFEKEGEEGGNIRCAKRKREMHVSLAEEGGRGGTRVREKNLEHSAPNRCLNRSRARGDKLLLFRFLASHDAGLLSRLNVGVREKHYRDQPPAEKNPATPGSLSAFDAAESILHSAHASF